MRLRAVISSARAYARVCSLAAHVRLRTAPGMAPAVVRSKLASIFSRADSGAELIKQIARVHNVINNSIGLRPHDENIVDIVFMTTEGGGRRAARRVQELVPQHTESTVWRSVIIVMHSGVPQQCLIRSGHHWYNSSRVCTCGTPSAQCHPRRRAAGIL